MTRLFRQAVVVIEWIAIAPLLVLAAFLPGDLISMGRKPACPEAAPDCFPWGTNLEGPFMGGGWQYESPYNYLVSGWFVEIVLICTLAVAFWLPAGKRLFALAGGLCVLWAGGYILPRIA